MAIPPRIAGPAGEDPPDRLRSGGGAGRPVPPLLLVLLLLPHLVVARFLGIRGGEGREEVPVLGRPRRLPRQALRHLRRPRPPGVQPPLRPRGGALPRQNLSHEANICRWEENSCSMDSLYDIDLISKIVPVILDNSKTWHEIMSRSMKSDGGMVHVQGIGRAELKDNPLYSKALVINRTASPLAWFMECKDRKSRSSVMLSYTFLPSMPAKKLRDAANKMKQILGDYDAIHVRRGDLLKNRKDRFGVERSLHPHLDRDTRPEFIKKRIAKWIPEGRTLFIASNERTSGFFSPLSDKYKLAYSSNFSSILEPVIENNYQLFMVERLMMRGAKTFVKTMKEFDNDLTLCDDPKKNTKVWQIPVYTDD
uniref:Uncharacterized protein n=1 Tax=Oryza barthii TaxID=65489 RepID=A0A0D3FIT9_9ORYZ